MSPDGPPSPSLAADAPRGLRVSVALKLTLLVGLALALLFSVLLAGSWFYWRGILKAQVDGHLSAIAESRRDVVKAQVSLLLQRAELNTDRGEMRSFLNDLENDRVRSSNRDSSQQSLARMSNGQPIVAAMLADKNGAVLLSTEPTEVGRNVRQQPEFLAGLNGPHLGVPYWAKGRYEALLAAPIRSRAEPARSYGVLITTVDVSQLAAVLQDVTGLGRTGESILGVRENDHLRFIFPPRNSPETKLVPASSAPALRIAIKGSESFLRNRDYRGIRVLAAGRPIGYGGWALVVKMDEEEAYAPIMESVRLGVFFGALAAAAGLAAAYAVARSFIRPLRRVAAAAAKVAAGEDGAQVPVNSGDEFGALSASFNAMTADLQTRRIERDHAEQALREADRRKDQFLATLGHELRNPLSAIAHAVRMWHDAPDESEAAGLARTIIERQTENLSRHVDDLLDVMRISEGKIELRRQPLDLGETIGRAVAAARMIIDEKGHEIVVTLADRDRWHLDADPTRIEQVVTNLLTNAVRYTPEGGRIQVSEEYAGGEAIVTVKDNGAGISAELMPFIFDLFTQGDYSRQHTTCGMGIGLHLCRQLVELHGGSITARSEGPDRGAEFTVRLPAKPGPAPAPAVPAPVAETTAAPHRRILLVDDNLDSATLLARLLTRRGHEVTTTADGEAALKLAHELRPDVLLLDIGLPGLDGYELARQLRADGFAETPMIAITGYAQEDDLAKAYAAGFDHHFAKPVDFDALAALLVAPPARATRRAAGESGQAAR